MPHIKVKGPLPGPTEPGDGCVVSLPTALQFSPWSLAVVSWKRAGLPSAPSLSVAACPIPWFSAFLVFHWAAVTVPFEAGPCRPVGSHGKATASLCSWLLCQLMLLFCSLAWVSGLQFTLLLPPTGLSLTYHPHLAWQLMTTQPAVHCALLLLFTSPAAQALWPSLPPAQSLV